MTVAILERQKFIKSLVSQLSFHPFINACWEGGAAGHNQLDQYSDIDLRLEVEDNHIERAFEETEKALMSVASIAYKRREPEPNWHGHSHCFYKFIEFPDCFVLDLVIMKESSTNKFTDIERHGSPIIYFDKKNSIRTISSDTEEFKLKRKMRLNDLVLFFPFLKSVTLKAILRSKPLDAFARYHVLISSLVEILGMKYRPFRYDFGFRYCHNDFPDDIQIQLEKFCYPSNLKILEENIALVEKVFYQTVKHLETE
jgi:hypothetical protein